MKLYLVRHGQSETNRDLQFSGWAQVSLTEQGIADARRAGAYLKGRHFDRIYSSDLIRTVQTAHIALPGCEPVQLRILRENSVGSLQGKVKTECEAQFGKQFWVTPTGSDYTAFGGESHDILRDHARAFLKMLEEDPCEQVVAFTHEGILRCMLDVVLGSILNRQTVRCPNCTIAVFSYAQGRWALEAWNVTD